MLYIHFEPFNQRYSHLTFNLSTNVIHLFSYLKLGTDDDDQPGPPGPGPNKHRKLFKLKTLKYSYSHLTNNILLFFKIQIAIIVSAVAMPAVTASLDAILQLGVLIRR